MRRICHDDEDEESTPVDTLSVKNSSFNNNNNNGSDYHRNGSMDGVMPVSPAIQAATSPGGGGAGNGSVKSTENEGDIVGPVEQFVMRPALQGVIYKCRITRDRKGMVSRGLMRRWCPIKHVSEAIAPRLDISFGSQLTRLFLSW